jgi:uncharacterized protein YdaU (DUF1376 family)
MIEDAAYRRMLDLYYAAEKPLPLNIDGLYRLVRAKTKQEREAVDIVLQEFFHRQEDGWHNKRADEELVKGEARVKAAQENGKRGGRPKTQQEPDGFSLGSQKKAHQNQKPKAKEEEKTSPPSGGEGPDGPPDCPHEQIVALYHEALPDCPRVAEWNDARRAYLRNRWREKSKPNGKSQGYTTVEDGLVYWRRFFTYVAQSSFLTGKEEGREGRPPFVATLEWLVRPKNFVKVIEGTYHR